MRLSVLVRGGALVLALGAAAVVSTLYSFNQFDTVEDRFDGRCDPVAGVAGPEDIQAVPGLGKAFISSLDRRAGPEQRGAILAVSLTDPLDSAGWRDRTGGLPEKFRPLGISYYENGDVRRLFVVNEAGNGIEIYDAAPNGDLTHLETVAERRLTSPNDVVAVGPGSFYVSNDAQPGRASLLGRLQFIARAATGTVYYYDGAAFRVAASGLRFANGVAVNGDGSRIYVAESSGQALRIYDRDPANGALTLSRVEKMPIAVDNINIASDGALWIAGLPKPLAAAQAESAPVPSAVIRYRDSPESDGGEALTTVFINKGDAISAASAAAVADGKLLIGALLEKKYLICDLPK